MNPALLKALTTDYVRDLAEWVTRPLRAVDDARVTQDSEDDFEGKEETDV